jgi:hypothetical protein
MKTAEAVGGVVIAASTQLKQGVNERILGNSSALTSSWSAKPGALPQARIEHHAFGAKQVLERPYLKCILSFERGSMPISRRKNIRRYCAA